jgi:ADP-dependent NAD(P)H-hydrate dehydratase / NAD(P)H-hydrate epimerase
MRVVPRQFYAAAGVRELDRRAIAAGTPGAELMRRAAAAGWRELLRRWPRAGRIAVLCGPGNNGGDGYELARLARAAGLAVDLWRVGEPAALGDAVAARQAWLGEGGSERPYRGEALGGAEVIVDAIFGIGLARPPEGAARAAILAIDAARPAAGVLALDVPSGLDADRGSAPGEAVRADLTVTFLGAKPGLFTGAGPDFAGAVVLDDLGVAADAAVPAMATALDAGTPAQLLPRRARTAHKGHMGHVLLVGGDEGTAGAILLAARGALRAGAGWVSVATRAAHAAALTAAQPELMCHALEEPHRLRALLGRATVVAVGPGLGRGDWGRAAWAQVLAAPQPLVVDADGLNWLAEEPARRDDWVLTPHPGEAGRLLGCATAEVQRDRPAAAAALRDRYGGVCVLKGAGTLVQGQALGLCVPGNPGMASGGTGDALTGVVAGLLAQGLGAESAARVAVAAHAVAADRAAAAGERGLVASDLLAQLRPLLNP